jgi:hypothetical protein
MEKQSFRHAGWKKSWRTEKPSIARNPGDPDGNRPRLHDCASPEIIVAMHERRSWWERERGSKSQRRRLESQKEASGVAATPKGRFF